MTTPRPSGLAKHWTVVAVLAAAYFLAYFHRVSPAVLAQDLQRDFGINATALGWLSSMYFYLYGALQIPVGLLVDRYGARRVVTATTMLSFAGAVLFELAPDFTVAAIARALVGAGVAGIYIPALKTFSGWAGPQEFATVTGIMMAIGNLGALVATSPLAFFAGHVGWRMTFLVIGLLSFGLAVLCWKVVKDSEDPCRVKGGRRGRETASLFDWQVFRNEQVLLLGVALLGKYGPLMAFMGLWGGLYLSETYGMSRVTAGNFLMFISIGYALGSPLFGHLSDRVLKGRRPLLLSGTLVFVGTWLPFIFGWKLAPAVLGAILLLMGITGGGTGTVTFSMGKESVPASHAGTALSVINALAFLAVTVFQPLTGWLISRAGPAGGDPLSRYKLAFLICLGGAILGLAASLKTKETVVEGEATKTEVRVLPG
ncbi:MAG: MFS transporter [Betaproteobacteria bacterium]